MKRLRNHHIGVDQGSVLMFSDFENGGRMWSGDGARQRRKKVKFAESYRAPPAVHVSIAMWDTDGNTNQRADIAAEKITETGFELVFRTWGDSRVARVRADWMAVGELRHADDWELY
ncbi:H-type lectin domain-containing protein [Psychromarinibacter sp. C21-152]|uniref:H-type lectin domain-containing protein n=1 Tax=Psychromarinibacter sediminicola TaxID=3033385 RepID=A0AAE3NV23_9RHOB|nr:H-type lectin domain-containing protein [Psychromarinibacter sediminicola]MDF0601500.1 H-type lectin domain-containing protein [Psychromarinibacter sediminicola]